MHTTYKCQTVQIKMYLHDSIVSGNAYAGKNHPHKGNEDTVFECWDQCMVCEDLQQRQTSIMYVESLIMIARTYANKACKNQARYEHTCVV